MVTVEVKNSEEVKELDFPKLMKLNNSTKIVLFINETTGTCVRDCLNPKDVGEYCDEYIPSYYADFKGELTLKNKQ